MKEIIFAYAVLIRGIFEEKTGKVTNDAADDGDYDIGAITFYTKSIYFCYKMLTYHSATNAWRNLVLRSHIN